VGASTWGCTIGDFAPGGAAAALSAGLVLAPALLLRTATMIAITMPTATTAMPNAKPRRRQ
jgi:hypothetical protein